MKSSAFMQFQLFFFNCKMLTSQFLAQNEFYQPLGLGFRDAFEELKIKNILISLKKLKPCYFELEAICTKIAGAFPHKCLCKLPPTRYFFAILLHK